MTTFVHYGHGRSWHIVRLHTRAINGWKTLCGRYIETTDTMEELPQARSCETCLRIDKRRDDREDDGSTQNELVP